MKPRCWTSDSRCKFALQQRLEGLQGPSTSHCAPAQLLPAGLAGNSWRAGSGRQCCGGGRSPRRDGVELRMWGGALPAFTRRRLVWGALDEGLLLSVSWRSPGGIASPQDSGGRWEH